MCNPLQPKPPYFLSIISLYSSEFQPFQSIRLGTKYILPQHPSNRWIREIPHSQPTCFCKRPAFQFFKEVGMIGHTVSFCRWASRKIFPQDFFNFSRASYHIFHSYDYLLENAMIMENNYKRTSKSPSPETRQRISASLKGKPKSDITKGRISSSLKNY